MRIRALHLLAFGPFRGRTLRFENDGGLEVVFGPNEAGKSTTRRAVLGLFFGVPERTKDGHSIAAGDEVRVGASLEDGRGKTIEIVRRKGRKNTVLDQDGAATDEHVIAGLLGGMNAGAYESAYGLDHETLRKGGAALRVGNGELGETLFSAATGLTGLHGVLVELRREAEALFVPSGTKRPLNEAQRSFVAAKKLANEYAMSASKWVEAMAQIESARGELEALRKQRDALAEARQAMRVAIESSRVVEQHRAREVELESALVSARAELDAIAPSDALLSRVQAIADLQERLGSHRKAHADRPRVAAELDLVAERAARAKRETPHVAERTSAELPVDSHVRALSIEGATLRQRERQVESLEADARANFDRATSQLNASHEAHDASTLRDALERVARDGDLAARLAAARDQARRANALAESMLAAVDVRDGANRVALAAIETLPVPSADVVATHARLDVDRAARTRGAMEKKRRLEEERVEAERTLGALRAEGDVPTDDALARARAERDALWDALFQDALSTAAATRFERALRAADDIADRLRREATRVTRSLEIASTLAAIARKLDIAREEERTLEDESREAGRAWEALWAASKITPRSPEEMVAWRARFDAVVSGARRAGETNEGVALLEVAESAGRAALGAALAREGVVVEESASLVECEVRAKRVLAEREKVRVERAAAQAARESAERERDRAARERAALDRDRAEWGRRWSVASRALGLDEGASPEQVTAALDAASSLARIDDDSEKLRRRLAGIDRDAARFTEDVRAICAACAPDLSSTATEEACVDLARRVARASAERAQRETLEDQSRKLDAQARAARETRERAEQDVRDHPPSLESTETLDAQIVELDERIQQKSRHLGSVETGAKQFDQSPAIEQAAEAQRQLARVRDLTERYVRAKLAASAVARLLERYRKENQGPVLARASALFATLTLGAFSGLEVGFGEADEPVLVAVRDARRLETSALSDGTLDQLYLALRVASLERLTEARGALPLLLDDVLVHFDDQRAAAALAVLADLARKTQVILFTHHERIVELAKRTISDRDGSRTASVHDLAARTP